MGIDQDFDQPRARQEIRRFAFIALGVILFHIILMSFQMAHSRAYIFYRSRARQEILRFLSTALGVRPFAQNCARWDIFGTKSIVDFLGLFSSRSRKDFYPSRSA